MKYYIELNARDIVNQGKIEEYIRNIAADNDVEKPEILKWLDKQFRDYIQNRYKSVKKVTIFKENDPDWLKNSVKEGAALKVIFNIDLKEDTNLILNYFESLDNKELSKIFKLTFEVAFDKAKLWFEEKQLNDSEEDIEIVRTYKSGYSWVKLLTQKALNREGNLMHHCTKDEKNGYLEGIKSGKLSIYSLRSEENKPHCTIEVSIRRKIVMQIKGYANGPIVPKYVKYVKDFIEKPIDKNAYKQINDLELVGIVDINGTWYSKYKLPENAIVTTLNFRNDTFPVELPKNLTVNGSLNLLNSNITELPENLLVTGDLFLDGTEISKLPKNLKTGTLTLEDTNIEELPNDLVVTKDLSLRRSKITSIPDNYTVGSLILYGSKVEILPKNLTVGTLKLGHSKIKEIPSDIKVRTLDLSNSEVKILPDNLTITDLNLYKSKLEKLPKNLTINSSLHLGESYVRELSDNLTVIGSVYIGEDSNIESLPNNLRITESLLISGSKITEIPDGTKVGADLSCNGTKLQYLPDNLTIYRNLDLSDTNMDYLPENLKVGGNLGIINTLITRLPETLKVTKYIIISENMLKELEENGIPTHLKGKFKIRE